MLPDLSGIFYLAIVGLVALALGAIAGLSWLVWFVVNHVAIV